MKTTKIAGAQQFRLDFPSAIRGISPQPFVRTVIMRELDEPKILQSVSLGLGDGKNHCTRQCRILVTENGDGTDRKSTRLNSQSLMRISSAVFCLKKKNIKTQNT